MKFTAETALLLRQAARISRELGHSYVGSAHILAALAEKPGLTSQLLHYAGSQNQHMIAILRLLYGAGEAGLPLPQGLTGTAKAILRDAGREALAGHQTSVRPVHVLLALLRRQNCGACRE